jgi:Ala-tRNA(Pro) deacylase
MKCRERLEKYLRENGVGFEVMTHAQAFTMQEVAASLSVPGSQTAKVVIVCADDAKAMLVLQAPHRINTEKAGVLLGADKVRMAREEEFADLFPDCATGAMPPFGNLYDVPVYVDEALAAEQDIVFRVGTHREAMKVAYADFSRLARPTVGSFSWQM